MGTLSGREDTRSDSGSFGSTSLKSGARTTFRLIHRRKIQRMPCFGKLQLSFTKRLPKATKWSQAVNRAAVNYIYRLCPCLVVLFVFCLVFFYFPQKQKKKKKKKKKKS